MGAAARVDLPAGVNLPAPVSLTWAFVGLGGNLGGDAALLDRFRAAVEWLARQRYVADVRCSSVYRSAPLGAITAQPPFLNAVVACKPSSGLQPLRLLRDLLSLEMSLGRERSLQVRQGPRTIDLDLLLVGDCVVKRRVAPALVLPHPRLVDRAFVLWPLAELIGADTPLPIAGVSPARLLARPEAQRQVIARAFSAESIAPRDAVPWP